MKPYYRKRSAKMLESDEKFSRTCKQYRKIDNHPAKRTAFRQKPTNLGRNGKSARDRNQRVDGSRNSKQNGT
jgi:hypothetical protein